MLAEVLEHGQQVSKQMPSCDLDIEKMRDAKYAFARYQTAVHRCIESVFHKSAYRFLPSGKPRHEASVVE